MPGFVNIVGNDVCPFSGLRISRALFLYTHFQSPNVDYPLVSGFFRAPNAVNTFLLSPFQAPELCLNFPSRFSQAPNIMYSVVRSFSWT